MNKETMIRNYRKFSAADAYILGFIYQHNAYMVEVEDIMPRYMKVERCSMQNGGARKLQFRLNNQYKEELIRKGATCIGSEDVVIGDYNKGVEFERLVYEMNGQTYRGKDSVGFWVAGDININGRELQVKFEGAQIVVETTLENLKKKARD
jgi:hypothetical protein